MGHSLSTAITGACCLNNEKRNLAAILQHVYGIFVVETKTAEMYNMFTSKQLNTAFRAGTPKDPCEGLRPADDRVWRETARPPVFGKKWLSDVLLLFTGRFLMESTFVFIMAYST